jgi:tRNA A37 N6-isopentenylltransferase MiaA
MLRRVDAASALRIQPRDLKRLVRALEVYFLTGRPLTEHFAATASPLNDMEVIPVALRLPAGQIADRVARRVDTRTGRPSSISTACATPTRRARSSRRRTGATRGAS